MKLDIEYLQYITKDEIRILTAIEMGMRNHEWVPVVLIEKITHLKRGVVHKILRSIGKQKLINHTTKNYDGFQLNFLGYDFLALYVFLKRGYIKAVHRLIGSGKESDIYLCSGEDGSDLVLKLARLGRTSFRTVKNNRDYLQGRTQYNWLYLSRLSSLKEFLFMQTLHEHGFPTPKPIDSNRHAILMSRIPGQPLCKTKTIKDRQNVYNQAMDMIRKMTMYGLIHCDFNEFNLMQDEKENLYVIDFPQMVSTKHRNADMYFQRDIVCIKNLFLRKYNFVVEDEQDMDISDFEVIKRLDAEIRASGSNNKDEAELKDFDMLEDFIHDQSGDENDQSGDDIYPEDSDEDNASLDENLNDDQEEEIDEEEMIEEKIASKRVKKNSATMDIEEEPVVEDGEGQSNDEEEAEQDGPEITDELAQAIAKEGVNHERLNQIHKEKEDNMIKKAVKKKFKKKKQIRHNPNKPKDQRDKDKQKKCIVEIV